MATLPEFLTALQPADGRDVSAIRQIARVIREAGYIPRGKRGRGSPHLSLENAVDLLLGIYGSAYPRDAPLVLRKCHEMRFWCDCPSWYAPHIPLTLSEGQSFRSALAKMVELAPAIRGDCPPDAPPFVSVTIGEHACSINVEYSHVAERIYAGFAPDATSPLEGDRRASYSFGLPTLIAVNQAVNL